jgi:uncharacterized protein YcbX
MTIRIEQIYRYPVKGMRAERLERGQLEVGGGLRLDRAFAFTSGNLPPPEEETAWSPSRSFLQMTYYPQLAGFSAKVDEDAGTMAVTSPDEQTATAALDGTDDSAVNALMNRHFKAGPKGPIRLNRISAMPGHWDFADTTVSIINLASVEWLEYVSAMTLSGLRFRGNIYVSGLEPWQEFSLVGRTVRIGKTRLKLLRPAMRCAATSADPWSGDTSIDVPGMMRHYLGHLFCGIYARVLEGGDIFEDDHVRPVDDEPFNPASVVPAPTPDPLLWPRAAIVERGSDGAVSLRPADADWPFLPANAGARVMVHPGLDHMGEPVRTALSETSAAGRMTIAGNELDGLLDGARVIVSGPVPTGKGRA